MSFIIYKEDHDFIFSFSSLVEAEWEWELCWGSWHIHASWSKDYQPGRGQDGFLQGFGLSTAPSRPCLLLLTLTTPGAGWEGFGSTVCCFMPGDDLGQKCWNHLKGTFSLSLSLCSVKVLAGLPLPAMTVGQSQGSQTCRAQAVGSREVTSLQASLCHLVDCCQHCWRK